MRTGRCDADSRHTAGSLCVRPDVLVAEDDQMLACLLVDRLALLRLTAWVTDDPQEARHWVEGEKVPLLLDGSVFRQMDIPLCELPGRVIIWSADDELVEDGRRLGLRTVHKGDLEDLDRLLLEIAGTVKG